MTGGVRDTLAAAMLNRTRKARRWEDAPEFVRVEYRADADVALLALSSPEVVRVATEVLAMHTGAPMLDEVVWCCRAKRAPADHATHQWSVLVAALRGER